MYITNYMFAALFAVATVKICPKMPLRLFTVRTRWKCFTESWNQITLKWERKHVSRPMKHFGVLWESWPAWRNFLFCLVMFSDVSLCSNWGRAVCLWVICVACLRPNARSLSLTSTCCLQKEEVGTCFLSEKYRENPQTYICFFFIILEHQLMSAHPSAQRCKELIRGNGNTLSFPEAICFSNTQLHTHIHALL